MTTSATDKGATSVVGVVLLVGISLIGVTAVGAVGTQALTDITDESQTRQAENAFSQLDSSASAVAFGPSTSRRAVTLGLQSHQSAELTTVTDGQLTVTATDADTGSETILIDKSLTSLRYKSKSTVIDYQAGGVWRSQAGTSQSTMVTPPEFDYTGGTLTIPIATVSPDSTANKRATTIKSGQSGTQTVRTDRLEGKNLRIEVQSTHYQAWEDYFRTRLDGQSSVQSFDANQTVVVRLKQPAGNKQTYLTDAIKSYNDVQVTGGSTVDGNVVAGSSIDTRGGGTITGTTSETSTINSNNIDHLIDQRVTTAQNDPDAVVIDSGSVPSTFEGGKTYYSDDDLTITDSDFDVSNGDIDLVVSGDLKLENGQSNVTGICDGAFNDDGECTSDEKNSVNVYVEEDGFTQKSTHVVDVHDDHYRSFIVYAKSDVDVEVRGVFEGIIYAPSETTEETDNDEGQGVDCGDAMICITGGADFTGAIVGNRVVVAGDSTVTYPSSLQGAPITIDGSSQDRNRISYVHITTSELEFTSEGE